MAIYLTLFLAAISLAGFIVVFLVFQYTKINTYVDNRKSVLRTILEKETDDDVNIYVLIQDIGKQGRPLDRGGDVNENKWGVFLDQFVAGNLPKDIRKKEAIKRFIRDILCFRKRRRSSVALGLISIIGWVLEALTCLIFAYLLDFYVVPDTSIIFIGLTGGFGILLVFTFIYIGFSTGRSCP